MIKLKPSELATAIETAALARQPLMIHSAPGLGKTQITGQVAAKLGYKQYTWILSNRDAVDISGVPDVRDGRTYWNPPADLPSVGPCLWHIDEFNRCEQMTQNALLKLIDECALGTYRLPDPCAIVACINPGDRGTIEMSGAQKARWSHVELVADFPDWRKWALANDVEHIVIAFLSWRPDLLHSYDPKALGNPNPRAWVRVSNVIKLNPPANIKRALIEGLIGEGPAMEFAGFERVYLSLPQMDSIITNPTQAIIPGEPSARFAVAAGLAKRATPKNFGSILMYLDRMPEEYNLLCVNMATARQNGALLHTPEYNRWVANHPEFTA